MQTTEDQFQFFEGALFETLGRDVQVNEYRILRGGSINQAVQLDTTAGKYFIKYNTHSHEGMFETEAAGLKLISETGAIRVPEAINWGRRDGHDYLVLESIDYASPKPDYWDLLGQKMAALHRHTSDTYGLHFDNYIGSLQQFNTPYEDWIGFFVEKRLNAQAGLAYYNELISKEIYDKFQQLYKIIPGLLPTESPALLHGDLWSGNVITDETGTPCLVDPAVYYGNREMEIAFSMLFGGFDDHFCEAYHESFPLQPRFDERAPIYNIYPLLVHLNIFGIGYLPPILKTLHRFL